MGGTRIAGLGHHAPARVVANAEIEARLGLDEGWIARRTGIRERRWAAADEAVSDLAVPAAAMALAEAGMAPDAFGLVLLATSTPDHLLPPTAPLVAQRLGLSCGAVDLTGACAGFLYAFVLAEGFVRATGRAVLVIAANILSRRIDPDDRMTAALFADAAGALVLAPDGRREAGLLASALASDGTGYDLIQIPAGGSRRALTADTPARDGRMVMRDGRAVFAAAVEMMVSSCRQVFAEAAIAADEIACFAPHQANGRMIAAVADKLAIGPERTLSTLAEFGNTSAATIPFSLSQAKGARRLGQGDLLLLAAAGAGLAGGAAIYRL
ncbi:3-oxoacyl-[acyl-carrier-protein] synthase III [Chelatococcus sambhunathii]|uniref:3-oxopimeloyl-[acyl-carrier-protein] synthase n=1 Tax=Chelatococcus sambhunathii TaxID=363953 RepID=A0ABM9U8K6_9HYPH|nr:beta-ketoacyl-ACP synthase III [Chelatococcus sambhunathii]CUA90024.1 3-oxoacyl-[acyl-carrier-protein] synthase III [Chelatococcus sambhunathii]